MAGWSSNNKYALLGSLPRSSPMISYELSMGLSLVGILMIQRMSMARPIAISKDFETAVYQAIGD